MYKKYIFILVGVLVCGAYISGRTIGAAKARAEFSARANVWQTQVVQKLRITDDKIIKTGVRDIRRILREQYTIAD